MWYYFFMKKIMKFLALTAAFAIPASASAQVTCTGNLCPYIVNGSGGVSWVFFFGFLAIWFILMAFFVITFWKLFKKAGQPGWKILIPIYNMVILFRVGGLSGWFVLLSIIPFANLVIAVILCIRLAKAFGEHEAFGVGLLLLWIVFFPILAFGKSVYRGPYYGKENPLIAATPTTPAPSM